VALVAAAALYELVGALVGPARAPSDADWDAAARWVEARFQPGDLVTFAPAWSDPIGRMHLASALLPPEAIGRADDARYRRVFVIGPPGAHAPEEKGRRRVEDARFGRLAAARWEGGAVEVVHDFVAGLPPDAPARVRTGEVDFVPRRCIWLEPKTPTTIDFGEVPLGRAIVGYTGLDHFHARKIAQGPFELRVLVGDGEAAERLRVVHANGDGWRRFEIPTPAEDGRRARVRFVVSAPDPRERKACIAAEARR
jgi:hypothetical protein